LELETVKSTTLLPSEATAEVVSIDMKERRLFLFTIFNHEITSWMKLAPFRQVHGVGDLTWNSVEPIPLFSQLRDGAHQPTGVRISQLTKNGFDGTVFKDPSCIHHYHTVRYFCNHSKIMGNQHD